MGGPENFWYYPPYLRGRRNFAVVMDRGTYIFGDFWVFRDTYFCFATLLILLFKNITPE